MKVIKELPELERSLADIESIKVQLEEVAKQLLPTPPPPPPVPSKIAEEFSTQTSQTEVNTIEVGTETSSVQYKNKVSQCEVGTVASGDSTLKLLKALHLCLNYNSRMYNITKDSSNKIPDDVDYFGKLLLGQTSLSNFNDNLKISNQSASLFLEEVYILYRVFTNISVFCINRM